MWFIPIILFPIFPTWFYVSPFPWFFGTILLILGLLFLTLTRLTSKIYPKWGNKYFLFSALIRPLGIILICWAWLEILSIQKVPFVAPENSGLIYKLIACFFIACFFLIIADSFLRRLAVLPFVLFLGIFTVFYFLDFPDKYFTLGSWELAYYSLLFSTLLLFAIVFQVWSLCTLGIRRSFLYLKPSDDLIIHGPYKYKRHPQLFSAILSVISVFALLCIYYLYLSVFIFQLLNILIFVLGMILITIPEEKDLQKIFPEKYDAFKGRVPSFFSLRSFELNIHYLPALILSFVIFSASIPFSYFLDKLMLRSYYRISFGKGGGEGYSNFGLTSGPGFLLHKMNLVWSGSGYYEKKIAELDQFFKEIQTKKEFYWENCGKDGICVKDPDFFKNVIDGFQEVTENEREKSRFRPFGSIVSYFVYNEYYSRPEVRSIMEIFQNLPMNTSIYLCDKKYPPPGEWQQQNESVRHTNFKELPFKLNCSKGQIEAAFANTSYNPFFGGGTIMVICKKGMKYCEAFWPPPNFRKDE